MTPPTREGEEERRCICAALLDPDLPHSDFCPLCSGPTEGEIIAEYERLQAPLWRALAAVAGLKETANADSIVANIEVRFRDMERAAAIGLAHLDEANRIYATVARLT